MCERRPVARGAEEQRLVRLAARRQMRFGRLGTGEIDGDIGLGERAGQIARHGNIQGAHAGKLTGIAPQERALGRIHRAGDPDLARFRCDADNRLAHAASCTHEHRANHGRGSPEKKRLTPSKNPCARGA